MTLEGRRVLYISYNGMLDPLGQSQVLPYLRGLSKKGVRFTLLSFERFSSIKGEGLAKIERLRNQLAANNIEWHWLRYHRKPSLAATAYDVMNGIRHGQRLVKRNQIEMVHARSHIPAAIALVLSKRFGIKMIFDVRGLMAEEYVDAEHWKEGGIPHRLTKNVERKALAVSDGVVTLTEKIWPIIREWDGLRGRRVIHEVIPCCVDLELFKYRPAYRKARRSELQLENRFVLVYSGSVGSWYLCDRMADFFVRLLGICQNAHFLWLTQSNEEPIHRLMTERNILPQQYTIHAVAPADVSSYLCASDVGIAFYKPGLSKLATSPIKVTEYLACGLPVVINSGIGDADKLIATERVGAVVTEFSGGQYDGALTQIESLFAQTEESRRRARKTAEINLDLETVGVQRYERLYERILEHRD
jgi:glycosyltransferase involved in cell wall biosynthesis